MEAANRRHLANMRVVQKNLVYVIGLHPKLATEEVGSGYTLEMFELQVTMDGNRLYDQPTFSASLERSPKWSSTNDL